MYCGGEIIKVNNIIFKKKFADHASLVGRPCIILSECNNKLTLLPLTSSTSNAKDVVGFNVRFEKSDFEDCKRCFKPKDVSFANLNSMFQRDLIYHDILGYLRLKRYYELLKEIAEKRLEESMYCSEVYKDICSDLEYQRNNCEIILRKKD